jgi:hypothetical protein
VSTPVVVGWLVAFDVGEHVIDFYLLKLFVADRLR